MLSSHRLLPLRIYVYDMDGTHDEGIQINSEAQLNGPGTLLLQSAIDSSQALTRLVVVVYSGLRGLKRHATAKSLK